MTYRSDLLKTLRNGDNWPTFDRPDFLEELNDLADHAFSKNTIEGYLAALLIYHQLCEEMIRVLINCSFFYIQLSIFPQEIKPQKLNKKMFGQLLNELEQGVVDSKTKTFIANCKKLNDIRIRMVHKLTLKTSTADIGRQIKPAKTIFKKTYALFDQIYDNYRVTFKDF